MPSSSRRVRASATDLLTTEQQAVQDWLVAYPTGQPPAPQPAPIRLLAELPTRPDDGPWLELTTWVLYADARHAELPEAGPYPTPRPVLAAVVRFLTGVIARAHPGKAVEVRVPPFAAVQVGVAGATDERVTHGPTHTRGTPPNLVELSPQTLLRLADGRSSWSQELADGTITASGTHSDVHHLWPIVTSPSQHR